MSQNYCLVCRTTSSRIPHSRRTFVRATRTSAIPVQTIYNSSISLLITQSESETTLQYTLYPHALLNPQKPGDGIRSSGLAAQADGDYGPNMIVPGLTSSGSRSTGRSTVNVSAALRLLLPAATSLLPSLARRQLLLL